MKKIVVTLFVVLSSASSLAQTAPQIVSDRPGQAFTHQVVGKGVFQIQSGLDLNKAATNLIDQEVRTSVNEFRLGLSESFEISTVWNYSQTSTTNNATSFEDEFDGVSSWQLGFRYNLIAESDGWIPGIGIQTRFSMKQVSRNYQPSQIAPTTMLFTNHTLLDDLNVSFNGGVAYDGETAIPQYLYVISFAQNFTSDFGIIYEFYGNEYNDQESNYGGAGVFYFPNKDLQLDLYASMGKNQGVEEFYMSLGVSWRTWLFNR